MTTSSENRAMFLPVSTAPRASAIPSVGAGSDADIAAELTAICTERVSRRLWR